MTPGWPYPFGCTVTFGRTEPSGEYDELGNDILTTTTVTRDGCAWWPHGSDSEMDQAASRVTDMVDVATDPDLDVSAYGWFEVAEITGRRFQIEGFPTHWKSHLTGWRPNTVIVGKVVTG